MSTSTKQSGRKARLPVFNPKEKLTQRPKTARKRKGKMTTHAETKHDVAPVGTNPPPATSPATEPEKEKAIKDTDLRPSHFVAAAASREGKAGDEVKVVSEYVADGVGGPAAIETPNGLIKAFKGDTVVVLSNDDKYVRFAALEAATPLPPAKAEEKTAKAEEKKSEEKK